MKFNFESLAGHSMGNFRPDGQRMRRPGSYYVHGYGYSDGTQEYCRDYHCARNDDDGEYPVHNPRCRKLRRRATDDKSAGGGIPVRVRQSWVDETLDVR